VFRLAGLLLLLHARRPKRRVAISLADLRALAILFGLALLSKESLSSFRLKHCFSLRSRSVAGAIVGALSCATGLLWLPLCCCRTLVNRYLACLSAHLGAVL